MLLNEFLKEHRRVQEVEITTVKEAAIARQQELRLLHDLKIPQ